MIIRNTLNKTLTYKLDWKELVLNPWLNLIDWFNDKYLYNLMKSCFYLLEATYLEYTESLEKKSEQIIETNKVEDNTQVTINNNVSTWELKVEDVREAVKTIDKVKVKPKAKTVSKTKK